MGIAWITDHNVREKTLADHRSGLHPYRRQAFLPSGRSNEWRTIPWSAQPLPAVTPFAMNIRLFGQSAPAGPSIEDPAAGDCRLDGMLAGRRTSSVRLLFGIAAIQGRLVVGGGWSSSLVAPGGGTGLQLGSRHAAVLGVPHAGFLVLSVFPKDGKP